MPRYSAGAKDDVPRKAPIFGQHPATNARRSVRYGRGDSVKESEHQLLLNAMRNSGDAPPREELPIPFDIRPALRGILSAAPPQVEEMPDVMPTIRAMREKRAEHPIADMAAGFIPGVGVAQGIDDATDSNKAWWERGLGALGAVPGAGALGKAIIMGPIGLARAKKMGKTFKEMKGLHGKGIGEIPDYDASLRQGVLDVMRRTGRTVGGDQLVDHPELFKIYPELNDMPITLTSNKGGSFHPESGIEIGEFAHDKRSVALHELQHGVQEIEGFGKDFKGSNPGSAGSYEGYMQNPGEIEARVVQERRDLHPVRQLPMVPLDEHLQMNRYRAGQEDFGMQPDPFALMDAVRRGVRR